MRAAEDHRIGTARDFGPEKLAEAGTDRRGAHLACFDGLGEAMPGDTDDLRPSPEFLNHTLQQVTVERAGGRKDDHPAAAGLLGGGLHAGDHADERNPGECLAEVCQGSSGGGVAGDHDQFDVALEQPMGDCECPLSDLRGGPGAVGKPGCISEVEDSLGRGKLAEGAQNGEPSNARVEHPHGPCVHRCQGYHGDVAGPVRGPGAIVCRMTPELDVLLVPPGNRWPDTDACAVVDALRATTMAATLLHTGATAVIAAETESAARALARELGALLAGEVGGLPPAGFDLGNSPSSVKAATVAGREVVLFTTNGTRALCAAAARGPAAAACALNAAAAARWLAEWHRVAIVCAGEARGTVFALEDLAAAACIVRALVAARPGLELGDGARLALMLPDPVTAIGASAHADALRALGLGEDIAAAQAVDTVPLVPVVTARGAGWVRLEPVRA